jgi:hypothetical protein
MVDRLAPIAFLSQVEISMHNFLSQEAIDGLPIFSGTGRKEENSDE